MRSAGRAPAAAAQPPQLHTVPLVRTQLLASDVEGVPPPSGGKQLLAHLPGSHLAVVAVGSRLLLLDIGVRAAAAHQVACLADCGHCITAVAASSSPQRWAAALTSSTAHFVPVGVQQVGSGDNGAWPCLTAAAPGCRVLAWHPRQPVCALLHPGELRLMGIAAGGCQPAGPLLRNRSDSSRAGRCSLAWVASASPAGSPPFDEGHDGSSLGRLVVCWGGPQLELLSFGAGWQVTERRFLLLGLTGPVCGLAPAGGDAVLAAAIRPVGEWLRDADNQQQRAEEALGAAAMTLGLSAAASRQSASLLLPSAGDSPGTAVLPAAVLSGTNDASTELTASDLLAPAAQPSIPAMFMLSSPAKPAAPGQGAGAALQPAVAGQAAMLRLGPSSDGRHDTPVPLPLDTDLMHVAGNLAALACCRGTPAVCVLDASCGLALRQHAALQLPAGLPVDCALSIRGLAVASAVAVDDGSAAQQKLAWVLLAATPRGDAAPFASAALSGAGSRAAQLWLCCYRLRAGAAAAPVMPPGAQALPQALAEPAQNSPPPSLTMRAADADGALEAVLALQAAVRELRRDVAARLDSVDAQLDGLLRRMLR